jgi:sec-independent protein translocase protein TatA
MFSGLESPTHLLIVLVIILLLFGAKRIPELAKGLGMGLREFRKGVSDSYEKDELERGEERKEDERKGNTSSSTP